MVGVTHNIANVPPCYFYDRCSIEPERLMGLSVSDSATPSQLETCLAILRPRTATNYEYPADLKEDEFT